MRDLHTVVLEVLHSAHGEVFRALAELDLSLTQIKALHALDGADAELPLSGLAATLNVSLPAMSRSVEGLHARGFVERHEDPDDRRMKRVRITDAGREVPRALHAARLSHLQAFVADLPDEDAARLATALDPIAERLR